MRSCRIVIAIGFLISGTIWASNFPAKLPQYSIGFNASGDFNGDGKLDLVLLSICSPAPCSSSTIAVSLGSGNGRFQRPVVSTVGDVGLQLSGIAVGDFNNDHKLDIGLVSYSSFQPTTSALAIALGHGDGTFGAATVFPTESVIWSAPLVGDVNGDAKLDLVVFTDRWQLQVFLGLGNGTFLPLTNAAGAYGECVLADVNHDNKLDLVGISLQLGNGDGTFQPAQPISGIGNCPVVADFNGDGNLDIAEQSRNGESPSYYSQNGVNLYFGNGDGTFQPPVFHWLGGAGQSGFVYMSAGDFNGDGKPDLLVVRGGQFDIVLNKGGGQLWPAVGYLAPGWPGLLADLNGDRKTDLLLLRSTAPNKSVAIPVLAGLGGTLPLPRSYFLPAGNSAVYSSSIMAGDLNGDGKLDLVELSPESLTWRGGHLSRLLGNGDGTFKGLRDLLTGGKNSSGAALSDLNHDGKLDAVVVGGGSVNVHIGLGDGNFQSPLATTTRYATLPAVADFNGDGIPDVALNASARMILLGMGDGTFRIGTSLPAQFEILVAGDFNGDGKQDLAATFLGGVGILLGNGDGTFQPISPLRSGQTQKLLAADFNSDGQLDLAAVGTTALGNTVASIYLGNGNGTLRAAQNTYIRGGVSPLGAVTADFNQDGKADLAVSLNSSDVAVLMGAGTGRFQVPTFHYGGMGYFARGGPLVAGDLDGNGTQDLAVMTSESTVAILLNQ